MVACQQFKSSPGGTQQLTSWMGFHGGMSAIQIKPRRHTVTHLLDGISWWHVSNSNQAQEAHSNSLPGWDFMAACQNLSSYHFEILTFSPLSFESSGYCQM